MIFGLGYQLQGRFIRTSEKAVATETSPASSGRATLVWRLLESGDAAFGGHLGEANRVRELRSQFGEVFLCHPTGDRARPSDVDWYLEVPDLLDKLPERREADTMDGVYHPWLRQDRRLAE